MTPEERRAVLARRFDESLGQFDARIKGEQQRNAQERDARAAASVGTASGSPAGTGATGGRDGDLRSEAAGQAGAAGQDGAGGKSGGRGEHGKDGSGSAGNGRDRGVINGPGSGAADRGLPSGDDDDIVARRLRRAAEQETDPELKEKLWKEYTEYKRNASSGKG